MRATESQPPVQPNTVDRPIRRRGLIAVAWAGVIGLVLRATTEPVRAATALLYGNTVSNSLIENVARGPTLLHTSSGEYTATSPVLTIHGLNTNTIRATLHSGLGSLPATPGIRTGIYGTHGASAEAGAGVLGDDFGANAGYGVLGRSNKGLGDGIGVQGESSGGVGVRGVIPTTSSKNAIAVFGVNNSSYSSGIAGAGGFGIYGVSAKGHGLVGATGTFGGAAIVGASNGIDGAYAGAFYGPVVVTGNFAVFGTKSAAVPHADGTRRLIYSVESPESWFEDFGKATLDCGRARVTIDPEFAAIVDIDDYHVFLTAYDARYPLSVTSRTASDFVVEAGDTIADRSTLRAEFSWRIVAKRKDVVAIRFERLTIPAEPVLPDLAKTFHGGACSGGIR